MALSTTQYGYIIDPMVPFTDGKGNTIKDGFVRVFVAGSSTPVITYRNFDGATNQDLIELDNSGRTKTSVIGSKGLTYKVCVYDQLHSQESPILTVDKVSVIGANITAGAGATVVTGLDGLTTKPDGFVDASVVGTDGYVALDHTLVTDDLDTDAKVTAVENDRYIPLLNEDVNDPDSKMTLGRLWQWVLGKIKSLSTTITAFRTGDVIPVDGPSGTAKMPYEDLLRVTAVMTAVNVGNYSWKSNNIKSYLGFVGNGENPTWKRDDVSQSSHVSIPIQEGDVVKVTAHTPNDGVRGAFAFLTSSFTEGNQTDGASVPIGSFLKRLPITNGKAYIEIAGANDRYLCLTTKDGVGNVVSWDVDVIRDNNHLHRVKTFTGTIGVGDETRYWSDWYIKAGDRYKVVVELDYDNFTSGDGSSVTLNTNSVYGDRTSKVDLVLGYDDFKSVSFEKDFVATGYAEWFYLALETPLSGTLSYKIIVYEVLDDVLDLPIKDGMSVTALSDETDKTSDFKLYLEQGLTYKFDFKMPMFIGKKMLVQVLDSSDNVVGTIYKKETDFYVKDFTDFHFIYTAIADSVKCRVITNTTIGVDYSVKVTKTRNNFEGGYSYEGYKLDFFEKQYSRNRVARLSTYEGKAIQAMRFYGDKLFVFHHDGWCDVYDAYSFEKIGDLFKCPSTYETHATTATFGDVIPAGQDFPLVYISKGKYIDSTDMVCDVCQIAYSGGVWSSSDVQRITLDQSGFAAAGFETVWGYPMFLPVGDKLYTIRSHYNDQDPAYLGKNYFVITEFNLPDTANASVTLTASNVLRQFTSPIDFRLHQASQVRGNKLLTTYGDGGTSLGKPNGVRFQDFPSGKILTKIDLSDILTEIQTIDAFNGGVYVLFVNGSLYRFDF